MKDIVLPLLAGIAAYWLILLRWALVRDGTIHSSIKLWLLVSGIFLALAIIGVVRGESARSEITRLLSFVFGILLCAFVYRRSIRRRGDSYL
jgi:cytochrome c oxidase assembly factor CtaG